MSQEQKFKSLESKIRDIMEVGRVIHQPVNEAKSGMTQEESEIEEAHSDGTQARIKLPNVGRPDSPKPTSNSSILAKTGSIITKKIDEGNPPMFNSDNNFGLSKSLIDAARQIVEKKDQIVDEEQKEKKNIAEKANKEVGKTKSNPGEMMDMDGKTDVDLKPTTDDTTDDTDKDKKLGEVKKPRGKLNEKLNNISSIFRAVRPLINEAKDAHVRAAVSHPNATANHLTAALKDPDADVREAAASHPNATTDHLAMAIRDKDEYVKAAAIRHPNINADHLTTALKDPDADIRELAANHHNANADHLTTALKDPDSYVRKAAVRHPNANANHLTIAIRDKDADVREEAARHRNATANHLTAALKDPDADVRQAAASHPNLNADHLTKAIRDPDRHVKIAAIRHPNLNAGHLTTALKDPDARAREEAARHPNANADHLTKAIRDPARQVKLAAIRHPNLNADHLTTALKDPDAGVRELAAKHRNNPKVSGHSNLGESQQRHDKKVFEEFSDEELEMLDLIAVEIDEDRGRGRGRPRKDPQTQSTSDVPDVPHIVNQLRKEPRGGMLRVTFKNGETHQISAADAKKALDLHGAVVKPADRAVVAGHMAKSHAGFRGAIAGKKPEAKEPRIKRAATRGSTSLPPLKSLQPSGPAMSPQTIKSTAKAFAAYRDRNNKPMFGHNSGSSFKQDK